MGRTEHAHSQDGTTRDRLRRLAGRLGHLLVVFACMTAAWQAAPLMVGDALAVQDTRSRHMPKASENLPGGTESLWRQGETHQALGQLDDALFAFEGVLEIIRGLAAIDPFNQSLRRSESLALDHVGDVHEDAGDLALALAAYEESLQIRRDLTTLDPTNIKWQTNLVIGLYRMGIDEAQQERHFEEALSILRRLAGEGLLTENQTGWIGFFERNLDGSDTEPVE